MKAWTALLRSRPKPRAILPMLLLASPALAADPRYDDLCATNPAYSQEVMRSVLDAQLAKDHDPSLDSAPPDQIAAQAVQQGITDCATEMQRNPALYTTLAGLPLTERVIGWDAYNTSCGDRSVSKADCVSAEVASMRALKHMMAVDQPPGSRALVQDCELVLKADPAMTDWRECVDQGLSHHPPPGRAAACKLSLSWHVAKTGAEAGRLVSACLAGG